MKTTWSCAILGLALTGCAQVLGIPDDPEVVGRWRCLDEPASPPVPLRTRAEVKVQACNFMSPGCSQKVEGLTAKVCPKVDLNCNNVVVDDIVDVGGLLTFSVPSPPVDGFDGYLEVLSSVELCTDEVFGSFSETMCQLLSQQRGCDPTAPDERCLAPVYARALFFMNPPIFNDVQRPLMLPLIPAAEIPTMLAGAGATLDPSKGNLFVTALDCDATPASGVTYNIDKNEQGVTKQLYVHDGVPTPSNIGTDDSGVGGFLGVPQGYANVTGFNESQDEVGVSGVHTAPFTMTYTAIAPF